MARDPLTSLGGADPRFPATSWSLVLAAGRSDEAVRRAALEHLAEAYWKPVYAYFVFQWRHDNETAKDLAQAFFASILERDALAGISPEAGRFRAFLRASLANFARNARRDERAAKRGGRARALPLDAVAAIDPQSGPATSAEEAFDLAWRSEVLATALSTVRQELAATGRELRWRIFEAAVLAGEDRPTYEALAERFGVRTTDVTNHLHAVRQRLRRAIREQLLEGLADPRDLDTEWQAVLQPRR